MSILDVLTGNGGLDSRLPRVYGVIVGIVTNVDDPLSSARVKLRFPVLGEEESEWARVAVPMAGPDAGQFFRPEVDDEVLVAFEMGDIRYPYVLGYLWGRHSPPETDNNKRLIKSRAGHRILLDDTPGTGGITLETAGGQKIQLSDGPTPTLTIDAGAGGNLKINCLSLEITATTSVTVNAPKTNINGIMMGQMIKTDVIVATSVIGTSYTPGAGNIW